MPIMAAAFSTPSLPVRSRFYERIPLRAGTGLLFRPSEDEKILWQGSPNWRTLAVHLCHVRTITIHFALLMLWRIAVAYSDGTSISLALEIAAWLAALCGIVMTIALWFAFLAARTTIYTVTTRRVVLRYGIAFTKAVNVPLRMVKSVGLRMHSNGTGPWRFTDRHRKLPISFFGRMSGPGGSHCRSLCCAPSLNRKRRQRL